MKYICFIFFFFVLQSPFFTSANFDFFKLAETWPTTFCKAPTRCVSVPSKFTIHGLWPSNNTDPQPSQCSKEPYDSPKIKNMLGPRLRNDWTALKGNGDGFWDYEWAEHGTCSLKQQDDYFTLALDLYAKHDIKGLLQNDGISSAGPSKSYPTRKILNAIKKGTGKDPQLLCSKISKELVEVRLCFDKSADPQYENCKPTSISCGQFVYFP